MVKIVSYEDWQMYFDTESGKYFATDEYGIHECRLVALTDDSNHTDTELLNGDFVGEDFDYGGEFDEPIRIDLGIEENIHKFDYVYQYGYWKKI